MIVCYKNIELTWLYTPYLLMKMVKIAARDQVFLSIIVMGHDSDGSRVVMKHEYMSLDHPGIFKGLHVSRKGQ